MPTVSLRRTGAPSRRAFTLLELLVGFVCVSILVAATAVTYESVISRVQDSKARATLISAAQAVSLNADDAGAFTTDSFAAAAPSVTVTVTPSPGTTAAGAATVTFTTGASAQYGDVAYAISADGRQVGLAMRSETGACFATSVLSDTAGTIVPLGSVCTGHAAGELLFGWDRIPGPTGSMPTSFADEPATGTFTLPQPGTLRISAASDATFATTAQADAGTFAAASTGPQSTTVTLTPTARWTGPYTLFVEAVDTAGNISAPVPVTGTVILPPAPTAPDGLTATAGDKQVLLQWQQVTTPRPAAGYDVFRDGTLVGSTGAAGRTLIDSGLTNGQTYSYQVAARDVYGQSSDRSAPVVARPLPPAPGAPTLAGDASDAAATLTWSVVAGATQYAVFRDGTQLTTTGGTSLKDAPLANGQTYTYRVAAVDPYGQSSPQSAPVTVTPLPPAPPAPTGLTATAEDAAVTLTWQPVSSPDVTVYRVWQAPGVLVGVTTAAQTTLKVTGLTNGTSYTFTVTAYDSFGQASAPSNPATATPMPAAPSSPTGLSAAAGDQRVTVAWNAVTDPSLARYDVLRDGAVVAQVPAGTVMRTDTGLTNGRTYGYQVRAIDTFGQMSAVTATVFAVPLPPTPSAPTGTVAATVETVPTTATMGTDAKPGWTWTQQVAASPSGPWASRLNQTDGTVSNTVTTTGQQTDGTGGHVEGRLTFTPAAGWVGQQTVWVRLTDGASRTSESTAVTLTSECNPSLTHPLGNVCSPGRTFAAVVDTLVVDNHTTIHGDLSVSGAATVSNQMTVTAGDVTGAGTVRAGTLTVNGGANVSIAGDVDISDGGLTNSSPQTTIGGNLLVSGGSVTANKSLTVGGKVWVDSPGTVSGPVSASGGVRTGPGLVPGSSPARRPTYAGGVTFDQAFTSSAALASWWSANNASVGAVGKRTLHLTAATPTTLSLSGTLTGDVLLAVDGPVTVTSWPGGSGSLTVVARDAGAGSLVVAGASVPSSVRLTLVSAGTVSFVNQTVFYGQVFAATMHVSQNTELFARPSAAWTATALTE